MVKSETCIEGKERGQLVSSLRRTHDSGGVHQRTMKLGTEDKGSEENLNKKENVGRAIVRYEGARLDSDRKKKGEKDHQSTNM